MPYGGGRHEHGQNFLIDSKVRRRMIALVNGTVGPMIEIGPGSGALTRGLGALGRPLTAVEIDNRNVNRLRRLSLDNVTVIHGDFLDWELPTYSHVIVGNLPFHLTTSILRKILHSRGWTDAVLMVQWEVARRRAGVGGASMMTAQWWPWVEFAVSARVPKTAFRPMPSVDGGILVMQRRTAPLIPEASRRDYQSFIHRMFTGRGNGIANILIQTRAGLRRDQIHGQLMDLGISPRALPKQLTDVQWAGLYELVQKSSVKATTPRGHGRRR